ncbi:MAG TPA: extracellular solute-binding protein [Clostridiaceae bacterium]|nr:extracellular solute-binding protein [Clostridiaceae bacterium]
MSLKKTCIRTLAVLLVLSMAWGGLASAQVSAEVIHNEKGVLPIVNEPITLTVGVSQNTMVQDWQTNKQTLYLEEKTGINLEFVVYPLNEMQTKLELAIAAGGGDLPDILLFETPGIRQSVLMPWAEAGMILPLTEYYDSLLYWGKETLALSDDIDLDFVKKYLTSYDGEIYGVYGITESINNQYAISRVLMYGPWLEALDKEMPATTEEFYNYLIDMRDKDPNGNGIRDEIPFSGYSGALDNAKRFLMTPFVYTQQDYWIAEDGVISSAATKDGWREGLRYVNKLFSEGLIDPAMFTQDQATLTVALSQEPNVIGGYARWSTTNLAADDADRYLYRRLEQLQGPDGKTVKSWWPSMPTIDAVITKNCEHPEVAFMLLDYLNSIEMSIITRYGYEGVNWFPNDEETIKAQQEKFIEFWQNQPENLLEKFYGEDALPLVAKNRYDTTQWGTLQNDWWAGVGPDSMTYHLDTQFYDLGNLDNELSAMSYVNEFIAKYAYEQAAQYRDISKVVTGLVFTQEEQEVVNRYFSEILSYINESWAAFAIGAMDVNNDGVWQDYLNTLEKMGIDKVTEAVQTCYTRMNQ